MAVTTAQLKNLILAKIGDHEGTTPVAQNIDTLWNLYDYKTAYPNGYRLQYLYTLKEAIMLMRGVSFVNGFVESGVRNDELSDENVILNAIMKETEAEIAKIETQASALRAPQLGTLTRTSPIMPGDAPYPETAFAPDPNSRSLRGDPVVLPPTPQRN